MWLIESYLELPEVGAGLWINWLSVDITILPFATVNNCHFIVSQLSIVVLRQLNDYQMTIE